MTASLDNTREGKALFREPHNAPRTMAQLRALKWRRWRREARAWLRDLVRRIGDEGWRTT